MKYRLSKVPGARKGCGTVLEGHQGTCVRRVTHTRLTIGKKELAVAHACRLCAGETHMDGSLVTLVLEGVLQAEPCEEE